jgi:hypothetical protein
MNERNCAILMWIIFKPSSGRKLESEVWKCFVYDKASDKSRCLVKLMEATASASNTGTATGDGAGTTEYECGQLLIGKNTTNLCNHIRSKHKAWNAELEKKEKEQKQ